MEEFKEKDGEWLYMPALGQVVCVGKGVIAELIVTGYEDENGRKMAASPDLLEALQLAEKAMVNGRNVTYPEWYGTIHKARAAIAKALGK